MKKISEWFKELPSPIREKALKNFKKDKSKDLKVSSLSHAILHGFGWCIDGSTGRKWSKLYDKIRDEEKLSIITETDEAIIAELVDHITQMHARLKNHGFIYKWDSKIGWYSLASKDSASWVFDTYILKL